MEDNEIELMDYLDIIWKRKKFIILSGLAIFSLAILVGFLLPSKWEVDGLIKPSLLVSQTASGEFEELLLGKPDEIINQIKQGSYNTEIASRLKIELAKLPKIRAEKLDETNLVRISLRTRNKEVGKRILRTLFELVTEETNAKTEIEIKGLEQEIDNLNKKLELVRQRISELEKDASEIRNRIRRLENEQRSTLQDPSRMETESLTMLLFSNEIQQNQWYLSELKELLNKKTLEEKETIEQINQLNQRRNRVALTETVKEPIPSLSPASPNRILVISISLIVGILLVILIAFFLEYVESKKMESNP